jgi:deoxyribonuclease-4
VVGAAEARSADVPTVASVDEVVRDELGAHVSVAGGIELAPDRASAIRSVNFQLFTKQPNRWAEREVSEDQSRRFREARIRRGIGAAASHDSYLINLSSPDQGLWRRSVESFRSEYERCVALGVELLVTHPGNATDGDTASGIARNAEGVGRVLEAIEAPTKVLLEITAGSGTSVGGGFEELAAILERIPHDVRHRVGVCFDTCHAYAAGYDLVGDYDGVWRRFDDVLGLARLGLFHLNDSKHPRGSRKDRHEHIGEGTLGEGPFRRIMNEERFAGIPKLLETPKGEDLTTEDLRNLGRLRSFRSTT